MRTGSRSGRSSREAEAMRCRKCKGKAVLDIPRHHTAFCKACLTEFVCAQVERAVAEERMFTTADRVRRPTGSVCGTLKRYHFNRAAVMKGYNVLATGHNLDDEAARLLGNVLHWQEQYLEKQGPTLPDSVEGFAKKVKPLYRLAER